MSLMESLRRIASAAALLAPLALALAAGCAPGVVGRTAEGAEIVQLPLRLSNAYLIKTKTPILIDAGTYGDMQDLERQLLEHGVRLRDLRLVVVTHAHADHAGLASDLRQRTGAALVLGAGDVAQAERGRNDDLKPTSFMATLLKPTIPQNFPEFMPDREITSTAPLDLAPWGIRGSVVQMPGHTQGSVVVVLENKVAFVGDEMLGGNLGGMLFAHTPGEHYYQADAAENRRNVGALLGQGIETFYLGHGGPVKREDVVRELGF